MKQENPRNYFAVIDTETTWSDKVMSIGIVIANANTFRPAVKRYYLITPECTMGGMYSHQLVTKQIEPDETKSRATLMPSIIRTLQSYNVKAIFAYNASFDYKHLPELQEYQWYDIIRIAAYRQHNPKIPASAECFSTGRMKRNFGVEPMMHILTGKAYYKETHNALCDALDELTLMKLLQHPIADYACARIN